MNEAEMYRKLDRLSELWKTLEERLKGTTVESRPLSLSRQDGGKVRLCYNGKPVAECTAEEKIAAASGLTEFMLRVKEVRKLMTLRAEEAITNLESVLAKLEGS